MVGNKLLLKTLLCFMWDVYLITLAESIPSLEAMSFVILVSTAVMLTKR